MRGSMSSTELTHPDILLEQGPLLIVNKPGGLLTQGPPGIDSLELRTKRWLIERDNKPGKAYLGVPHRLDRPASGVMVLAKHVRATRKLAEQFQNRTIKKTYWAIVEGVLDEGPQTWSDWMRKIPDMAQSEIVSEDHEQAKLAELNIKTLAIESDCSLVEIELITGRTHQIRLQTSTRGHAIVGDDLYGSTTPFGPDTADLRKRWIALHARTICLTHPMTDEPIEMVAPLSDHWTSCGLFTKLLNDDRHEA